jgi:ferrous iron transport protein A
MLRRMLDMGFVPGTVVEVARKAPLGDPVEYKVMNSSVSLRNDLASKVLVRPIEESEGN